MKRVITTFAAVSVLSIASVFADESSHRKATDEMFNVMDMKALHEQSFKFMEDAQNLMPGVGAPTQGILDFMKKHMSWEAVKKDMITIYMEEFTEDDIVALTKFYKTPLGQKLNLKQPVIQSKAAKLAQSRTMKHMDELMKIITDSVQLPKENGVFTRICGFEKTKVINQ